MRGVAFLRLQQFTRAIEDLTEVISSGPLPEDREPLSLETFVEEASNAGALYNRGIAYSKLDMLDDAVEDFSAVLEMNPNHVQAAYSRAACYNAQGQLTKAIEDYNLALLKDNKETTVDKGLPASPKSRRRGSMAVGAEAFVEVSELGGANTPGWGEDRPPTTS